MPQLAQAAGLRVRRVRFRRDDWWRDDHGPLLARRDDDTAVALLPEVRGYVCFDPAAGSRRRLTAADAARLARTAYMIYDRSWQRVRRPWDLVRQAARAARDDLALVVLTALAAALLTAVVPLAGASLIEDWRTIVLGGLALAVGLLLLCEAIGLAARRRFQARAEHGAFAALWERVIRLPASFLRRHDPTDLERRAGCLDEAVALVAGSPLSQLLGGAVLLVSLLVLALFAPRVALVVAVLLPPAVAVPALIERRVQIESRRRFAQVARNRSFLLDLLTGMARLRALGGAARLCDRWEEDYGAEMARNAALRGLAGGRRVCEEVYRLLVPAAAVLATAWAGVGAGAFVGCYLAAGQAVAAALGLGAVAAAVVRVRSLLERVGPLLTTPLEQREGKRPAAPLRGTLEGRDLHFRYEGSTTPALDGVSVRVGPGEIVALAGPSGSGKSTLLRVLLGFEEPARGVVCWDGVPLAELDPHAVRAQVGAVLQEDRLLEGTTRLNIGGLSRPSQAALREAARLAAVDTDIRRWPMQMETILGEEKVSGSQRQRILLAGQLLRRPRLVLLDEATSALDEAVQARLFANLRALGLPCVVVAHRPSTLWYADRIYRLHEGRVVQSGTPAEVLGEGAPPAVPPAEELPAAAPKVPLEILFRRAALERYLGPISPDAPATRPHLRFPWPTRFIISRKKGEGDASTPGS